MTRLKNISLVLLIFFGFISCSNNTDIIKLTNKIDNESIYLRYNSSNETSIISLNHFTNMDLENDIVIDNTGMFFYKFSKDSLIIHVYGLDKSSIDKMKKFKTKLRYWEMENGNADFCDFACEYKKLGFSFFPTSLEYVAQNHAKDCR